METGTAREARVRGPSDPDEPRPDEDAGTDIVPPTAIDVNQQPEPSQRPESTSHGAAGTARSRVDGEPARARSHRSFTDIAARVFPPAVLALAIVAAIVLASADWAWAGPAHPADLAVALLVASLAGALGLLAAAVRRDAWTGTRLLALALALAAAIQADAFVGGGGGWLLPAGWHVPVSLAVVSIALVAMAAIEFRSHLPGTLLEMLADVAMVAAVSGAGAYLLLAPAASAPGGWVVFPVAGLSVLVLASWSLLVLWCPTPTHLGQLAFAAAVAAAGFMLDLDPGEAMLDPAPALAWSLGVLGLAAVLGLEADIRRDRPSPFVGSWVRPALLAVTLAAAGVVLVKTWGGAEGHPRIDAMAALLAVVVAVALRILVGQDRATRATSRLTEALAQREAAIASLTRANQAMTAQEERLRLLLESAVDGIVELDDAETIVRANDAFCSMIELPPEMVVGRSWLEVAESVPGGGGSLVALPEHLEAVLSVGGATRYLEARVSALPTNPPGRLLLVRDVTVSKVAEQTIRTLFQFLQDRDEKRTQLLQRTNSAIESERNRIARDLHDGPIQGVTGAMLSLEAVRLMLKAGQIERAAATLKEVQSELSAEADSLRRVMTNLRPPLLDERGLLPAVREIAERFQRENGVEAVVRTGPYTTVPQETETLAYRVIQEALSNVSKHADARRASIQIETGPGTLDVEIVDDGKGFDVADMPEFLRSGRVGLASMRERAELGGGTLTVWSRPGGGTRVRVSLPFDVLAGASFPTQRA